MPDYWSHHYDESGTFHERYEGIDKEDIGDWIANQSGGAEVAYIFYITPTGEVRQSYSFAVDEYEDWFEDYIEELEDKYGGGGPGAYGVGFISG